MELPRWRRREVRRRILSREKKNTSSPRCARGWAADFTLETPRNTMSVTHAHQSTHTHTLFHTRCQKIEENKNRCIPPKYARRPKAVTFLRKRYFQTQWNVETRKRNTSRPVTNFVLSNGIRDEGKPSTRLRIRMSFSWALLLNWAAQEQNWRSPGKSKMRFSTNQLLIMVFCRCGRNNNHKLFKLEYSPRK